MISFQKPTPRCVDRIGQKRKLENGMAQARILVWDRDGRQCRYCGRRLIRNPDAWLHGEVHHITPRARLAKGAYALTANLVLLCPEHHRAAQAYRLFIRGNADKVLKFSPAFSGARRGDPT